MLRLIKFYNLPVQRHDGGWGGGDVFLESGRSEDGFELLIALVAGGENDDVSFDRLGVVVVDDETVFGEGEGVGFSQDNATFFHFLVEFWRDGCNLA